ncbi:helix-turn-helix domain-containing protein [uncultured Campylobacter sp.]|uniref:helix-turn-helix domain-containing protein n=1 Tax=uncultured Campylobacter sp. TaxID=218934 RepID=UPI00262CC2C0|nr:helix-turn-helix domain-containing protein [uncultured Campylobacter sp.]
MKKVSIGEAAEILGISKEAVYNRIRRNSLRAEESGGVRYVLLDDEMQQSEPASQNSAKSPRTSGAAGTQSFIDYLIKEISELKGKIEALQSDKDRLHKEKEEILIASKDEIKLMYKERDEKLRYFLSFFDKPLLSSKSREAKPYDVEVKEKAYDEREWTSLAKFIRSLKRKKRPKAQSLIIENIGKSEFIRVEGNELLINQSLDIKSLKGKK